MNELTLTKMEKILWDNDLEKMFTNHLEDAESSLQWLKSCPKFYDQSEETWMPQIKGCESRIYTLKQAIKLIKIYSDEINLIKETKC